MLKELFQDLWTKAQNAVPVTTFEDQNGQPYIVLPNGTLQQAKQAGFPTITLSTLTGLVDYAKANKDERPLTEGLVQVVSHGHVRFLTPAYGDWEQRDCWVGAAFDAPEQFRFGSYLELEQFIIEVQSRFHDSLDRHRLLQLVGSLTAGAASTASDDGITQTVQTKVGVSLKGKAAVENPFRLQPFRTFHEVEQPASPFILRVRAAEASVPQVALFESDGGRWKNLAMQSVANYLKRELPEGLTVVA